MVAQDGSSNGTIRGAKVTGGIALALSSGGWTITHNEIINKAVSSTESSGHTITDNVFVNAPISLLIGNATVIRGNRFVGTGSGVILIEGSIQITGNTFRGSRIGVHVRPTSLGQVGGTTVTGNRFSRNGAAGMFLEARDLLPGATVTIARNVFDRNGRSSGGLTDSAGRAVDDGLHVDVPAGATIVISGNLATRNADLGIEAPNGATDAGVPNHARRNGNPAQCLGVVCLP